MRNSCYVIGPGNHPPTQITSVIWMNKETISYVRPSLCLLWEPSQSPPPIIQPGDPMFRPGAMFWPGARIFVFFRRVSRIMASRGRGPMFRPGGPMCRPGPSQGPYVLAGVGTWGGGRLRRVPQYSFPPSVSSSSSSSSSSSYISFYFFVFSSPPFDG